MKNFTKIFMETFTENFMASLKYHKFEKYVHNVNYLGLHTLK